MAERDSLWVTAAVDQEEARVGTGAGWFPATNNVKALTGLRPGPANPGVVTATGTPDANVHVAPFQAVLQSTRGATGGVYLMALDTTKDINILSTPAHASLARRDLIIAHQSDTYYGDADSQMRVRQIPGTPSGSPADPSLASYPDSITLARVTVPPNVTSILGSYINDLRPASTVALGGLLPVASQTIRNALTGVYDGMQIYRRDRDWVEVYDGASWRVTGTAKVSAFSDLAAVTNPYAGQVATPGDGNVYRHDGTAWRYDPYRAVQTVATTTASVTFSSIPSSLRLVDITYRAKCSDATSPRFLLARFNGSSAASYYDHTVYWLGAGTGTPSVGQNIGQTRGIAGLALGSDAAAGVNFSTGELNVGNWNPVATDPALHWRSTSGGMHGSAGFQCTAAGTAALTGPYTSITLFFDSGNVVAGSEFLLEGRD